MRYFNLLDQCLTQIDTAIRTLLPPEKREAARASPAQDLMEPHLNMQERKHVAGLMRVNHAGEVCAQALYQGQALTANLAHVREQMKQAASEEVDHLAWCEQRLKELGSEPSLLNPFWYLGSLMLGALAGFAGDKVSLGFLAETENQVSAHLKSHLKRLPPQDNKSRVIIEEMERDEANHAHEALEAGAMDLPLPVKRIMSMVSELMTKTAYYI
ncbi:ubiquinone biosynthesis protein [Legionella birminghamensis]|uniref:3-demethoxyubiquinol 3-hydroxylase n=1 Tax=Legionella birminghamensis TaxID=28083 RepID=A0A378IDL8_9GAMM|nr:2-polyprenyl-3-methyl-6-methoxy-1,4-benzoquinone monooxygenase [Legionella birminghamensis]KTC75345.1 ubiquinone biosynthesis protein [Legionella birminghamensis]STX33113.1 ubiquinone biosynthesis protein [Legionella birminghamensis]